MDLHSIRRMSSFDKRLASSQDALDYTQSIIDTIRDPMLVLDSQLRVVTASRAFCRVFQVSGKETEGRLVYSLGDSQWNIPALRQALEVILPEQSSFDGFEVTHTFPNIGLRTMLLNARKIWRVQNQVKLILLVFEDVTERKVIEGRLEKVTSELKHSNADLEHFVRAAGHDLRAPLNSIVQFSQLLERRSKDRLDEEGLRYLQLITNGGKRMSKLLSDLLDYATLPQTPPGQRVAIWAQPVCQEALSNLNASISESNAEVFCAIGEGVRVAVEPTLLVLLFQNLIGNAIHYARASVTPSIRVSAQEHRDCWKFAVQDNGIGIEEGLRRQIFEPFKRLHGSERPGSGIGLSLCQRIVEPAGGKIWVESEPGQGSTFFFLLPKA